MSRDNCGRSGDASVVRNEVEVLVLLVAVAVVLGVVLLRVDEFMTVFMDVICVPEKFELVRDRPP